MKHSKHLKTILNLYFKEGAGLSKIGRILGIPKSSIYNLLKKHGYQLRDTPFQTKTPKVSDDKICEYWQKLYMAGHTLKETANQLGVSPSYLSERSKLLKLPTKDKDFYNSKDWKKKEAATKKVYNQYKGGKLTTEQAANALGISPSQTLRRFKHFNLELIKPKGNTLSNKEKKQINVKYLEGLSLNEIAKQHGISSKAVEKVLRSFNTKTRNLSDSVNNAFAMGKMPGRTSINKNLNINFLDGMSDKLAWFLGAVCSDGSIGHGYGNSKNMSMFSLRTKDLDFAEKLAALINVPVHKSAGMYVIQTTNKCFISKIESFGIHPNKSESILIPPQIPDYLMRHFIRGYIDGDGAFFKRNKLKGSVSLGFNLCSRSKEIILAITNILLIQADIRLERKRTSKTAINSNHHEELSIYKLRFRSSLTMYYIETSSVNNLYKLSLYLYGNINESLCLDRKRELLLGYINSKFGGSGTQIIY